MNKRKIFSLIERIGLEIDQAEVYKNSVHFNQARRLLKNELPQAISEMEAECVERPSLTGLKSS